MKFDLKNKITGFNWNIVDLGRGGHFVTTKPFGDNL
jgi:hypothetical protein